jgi:hypothetical protein
MSYASKASIFQIPNIGYVKNNLLNNAITRNEKILAQDILWKSNGIILEQFKETDKYRKAIFPSCWKYVRNTEDNFGRSGWYVNPNGEKIIEVFMKDAIYETSCRIKFLKLEVHI